MTTNLHRIWRCSAVDINFELQNCRTKQPTGKQHGEGKIQIHILDREENNDNDVAAHLSRYDFDFS